MGYRSHSCLYLAGWWNDDLAPCTYAHDTVGPPNKDTLGTALIVLCKEVVLFGRVKCTCKYYVKDHLGPQAVSLVEMFITLCPYLGESTIGSSIVHKNLCTCINDTVGSVLVDSIM